jgi:hypothetical protein
VVSTVELNPEPMVLEAFRAFLEFFFATVVLVGEEYFENAYAEEMGKRGRTFRLEVEDDNDPSATSVTYGRPVKKLLFY